MDIECCHLKVSFLVRYLLFVCVTAFGLVAIIGSGGGGGSDTTPPPSGSLSGTVSGTEIIAVNDNGEIVASDDTTGKTADGNGNYPFTLSGIPLNINIRVYLITNDGVYPMYFDSTGDSNPDTNVFSLSAVTDIDLGFVDTGVVGQAGKAIPDNDPTDSSGVSAMSENAAVPASARLVGVWGYGRLKHRNSGAWASQSGVFTYSADGTGMSEWDENDNNSLSSKTFTWDWRATTNSDGSIKLVRTFADASTKTRRIVLSDDNSVMIMDGTDALDKQRLRVAVRMDPDKTYANSDFSGEYYNAEYFHTTGPSHRSFSSITAADGAGNLTQDYTANTDNTVTTGVETHTYAVSANGSIAVDGMDPTFYLSGDNKLLVGALSTVADGWGVPIIMKKADKVYSTADVAGIWAFVIFGDSNGTEFFAEIGTMNCDSVGYCTSDYKQQRDGTVISGNNPPSTTTVQADGSFGDVFGMNTPSYAGVIGNDGNTFMFNQSFENTAARVIGVGVRCSNCVNLGTGGGGG